MKNIVENMMIAFNKMKILRNKTNHKNWKIKLVWLHRGILGATKTQS